MAPRPVVTVALWPVGVLLTSWHYLWRTTPLHRRECEGSPDGDGPPDLPSGLSRNGLQDIDDGVGALFHRRYQARYRGARLGAKELLGLVAENPDRVTPSEFARFTKTVGEGGVLRVGDEFLVRMPGPWNGPVRVVDVTPTSFRLVTLHGHLEAGQIEFRAAEADEEGGGDLLFTIESWARSGDRLSKALYQHVRMAKEVQLHLWTSFLERLAPLCGGRLTGGIDVETRFFGA